MITHHIKIQKHFNLQHFMQIVMVAKLLRIRFYKINGYIKVPDGIIYLVIFEYLTYDKVHNRIR